MTKKQIYDSLEKYKKDISPKTIDSLDSILKDKDTKCLNKLFNDLTDEVDIKNPPWTDVSECIMKSDCNKLKIIILEKLYKELNIKSDDKTKDPLDVEPLPVETLPVETLPVETLPVEPLVVEMEEEKVDPVCERIKKLEDKLEHLNVIVEMGYKNELSSKDLPKNTFSLLQKPKRNFIF